MKLELETDNKGMSNNFVDLFAIMTVSASSKCLAVWKLDKFSVFDESKSPAAVTDTRAVGRKPFVVL